MGDIFTQITEILKKLKHNLCLLYPKLLYNANDKTFNSGVVKGV